MACSTTTPVSWRASSGRLIPAGSPEEIEIRAVAVHAVERIVAVMRTSGVLVTARELDYFLWNRGQGARSRPFLAIGRARSSIDVRQRSDAHPGLGRLALGT